MGKNTYEIIPVSKPVDRDELVRIVTSYILAHLKKCEVETGQEGDEYTILIGVSKNKKKSFITLKILFSENSCAVKFESSSARPVANVALAAVTAAAMPAMWVSYGGLLATAGYRVVYMKNLKKDVLRLIRAYVS